MSKSFDKIDGKRVREQYFRSERRESKRKKDIDFNEKQFQGLNGRWEKKWRDLIDIE